MSEQQLACSECGPEFPLSASEQRFPRGEGLRAAEAVPRAPAGAGRVARRGDRGGDCHQEGPKSARGLLSSARQAT